MITIEMVWLECGKCGAPFGMSTLMNKKRREDGQVFYCINGHERVYRKSELDEAREALADKDRALANVRSQLLTAEVDAKRAREKASRFKCAHCQRDYATRAGVLKHQREAHQAPLRLAKNAGPDALNSKVS